MKRLLTVLFVLTSIMGFSIQAHSALSNLGTDSLGNRLIYDSDLNLIWYDYSHSQGTWQSQMNWASDLTVNYGGNVYDDWRLPSTVDGPFDEWDNSGNTSGGFNMTSSEMSYLFYAELGNQGMFDSSGNNTGCYPNCLTNSGPFTNLQQSGYWSGTEYAADPNVQNAAWSFYFDSGHQDISYKNNYQYYGLAVRVAPEPISSILFLAGGATLIGRKYIRRKKIEV